MATLRRRHVDRRVACIFLRDLGYRYEASGYYIRTGRTPEIFRAASTIKHGGDDMTPDQVEALRSNRVGIEQWADAEELAAVRRLDPEWDASA